MTINHQEISNRAARVRSRTCEPNTDHEAYELARDTQILLAELDKESQAHDATIGDSERHHEAADKLAQAIAELTGDNIGEHSSTNDPWENALASIEHFAKHHRAELDKAYQGGRDAAADAIEQMPYELGDEGWKALQNQAEEAGYPVEWVRGRRRRDDFTTATIGAAYQYGYRQAAKVARGVTR